MATKTATKGGCIIYFVDANGTIMVLTGNESNYVRDLEEAPEGAEMPKDWTFVKLIKYKEEISGGGITETVAKHKFTDRAKDLEKMLKIGEIRYDTPEEIERGKFHVNYRHLLKNCKKGIFKGGCEGSETPLQAAIREVKEELGMNIPAKDLKELPGGNCLNCQMFTCDIGERKRIFEEVIKDRHEKRYGELFEISFKPLSAIMTDMGRYNRISDCALTRFNENPPSSSEASASSAVAASTKSASSAVAVEVAASPKSEKETKTESEKGTKKGGKKSKRNRSRARAYARRRNKSYKRY